VLSDRGSEASSIFLELAAAVEREVFKAELMPDVQPQVTFDAAANELCATIGGERFALSPIDLRRKCRSPVNDPERCAADLRPVEIEPMGNYAVSIVWSDGHQSLFPYATFAGTF
jgi:hypothetical protein